MSVIVRGSRNAFRNLIRSFSITLILAISIGLSLVMLLSMQAVNKRIDTVKSSVGNTITVTPAGQRGFGGGGNPLTSANIATIKSTSHVVSVSSSLTDRLSTTGTNTGANAPTIAGSGGTTNLVSSINAGSLGQRFGGGGDQGGGQVVAFTPPITVTGTDTPDSTSVSGVNTFKITSGASINGSSGSNVALVGTELASKNNLVVGSTFTAYGQTITVQGIYDTGNTFSNGGIIMPLATVQNLSSQAGDVTMAIVQVDSLSNVVGTTSALESKLGSAADVVSSQDSVSDTLSSLQSIKTISLYSLIGALVAGSIIIFLTMLMIVRERRREIGVLKAIGSSNIKIVNQFVVEALTLTLTGAIVGILGGALLSNPVLGALVSSNSSSPSSGGAGGPAGGPIQITNGRGGSFSSSFGGATRGVGRAFSSASRSLQNLHTAVGFDILLWGLGAAILIAVLGSAIPAWLIAKVRPAEVMRAE